MSGAPIAEFEPDIVPGPVVKTILEIKKEYGQYSDEEIYTLLKQCNMDPEQATQQLQYYESFQVVKKKERKEKKVVSNNGRRGSNGRFSDYDGHARQESQNGPRFRHEKNGSRDGPARQENRSQNHTENNNGSRDGQARQEKRAPRAKGPLKKESKEAAPLPPAVASAKDESTTTKTKSNLEKNRPGKLNNISSGSKPGPGPTPASTPTNPTPTVPRQQPPIKKSSLGNSSSVGPPSSPSPSDPVVEPTPRNHGAIQRETRNQTLNVCFSGKQQAVMFPNRVLAPQAFNCDILFGSLDTVLEKSNDTTEAAASKNESKKESESPIDEPQPQPESTTPPQENISSGADLMFNQPKQQEVLPPVGRSQQETPQQGENGSTLQASNLTPPRATYPFVQNSYTSYMYPYYSAMYMPQVPRNVHQGAVMGHSGYANQVPMGAGANYPASFLHQQNMRPSSREENKEENVFYNLAQGQTMAYPPPPGAAAAAQGGHGFPSVYHQNQSMSAAPQAGGESVPLASYPGSQLQYGGPYWPNREN